MKFIRCLSFLIWQVGIGCLLLLSSGLNAGETDGPTPHCCYPYVLKPGERADGKQRITPINVKGQVWESCRRDTCGPGSAFHRDLNWSLCGCENGAIESPWDNKEIKPVNPRGNQLGIFTGRTDAEALILQPPDEKSRLIGKDPDAAKD